MYDERLAERVRVALAGYPSLGWVLGAGVLGHRLAHWGEIVALKGLQGRTGFPR